MREDKLPAGWVWTTLGEITISVSTANAIDTEREFVYIDIGSIDNTVFEITEPKTYTWANAPSRARQIVKTGDILFSTVRTYLKNIAQVPAEFDNQVASTGFCVIRPVENLIDPRFVFFYVTSNQFLEPLNTLQIGAVYPTVKDKDVFNQPFPLPPLSDQIRIAKLLDRLMEQLRSAQAALAEVPGLLRQFRQKVLTLGVQGELTREWRKQHKVSQWRKVNLGDVIQGKPKNGYSPKPVNYKTKTRVLTLSATTSGKFDPSFYKYCDEDIPHDSDVWLQPNDILIQRGNTREYVGTPAIYDGEPNEFIYPDLMIRIRANTLVKSEFLLFHLAEEGTRNYLRSKASGTTGNMPKINQPILISTPISLPSLFEQEALIQRIKHYFTLVDQLESDYEAAKFELDALPQSLLSKAFRGELCIPEPGTESAEILLARIRKEKARLEILEKQQRSQRQARKMKSEKKLELKALAAVLETSKGEWLSARMAWQQSEHRDDIEGFYAELKRLIETEQTVEEEKRGKESFLRMTQA